MESTDFFMTGYFPNAAAAALPTTTANFLPDHQLPADHSHFAVDDLLDFPNEDDDAIMTDGFFDNLSKDSAAPTADSPAFTPNHSSNSSSTSAGSAFPYQSFADSQFSSELCVPYDDLAELEWLSTFVDDSSFSTDQTLHMLPGSKSPTSGSPSSGAQFDQMEMERNVNSSMFQPDTPLPGKARSKRSRAAPGNWTTRLLHLTPSIKGSSNKKHETPNPDQNGPDSTIVRRCLHCGSEKTPQWRTGPMGPKTLCNACGVRYKSGRLVAEYRPAASPTFVPAKHSNSHRKVMELRRQKEMHVAQQEQFISHQSSIYGGGDQYLMNHNHHHHHHHHHHPIGGANFRHMI